jgi:hypothetical protein
MRLLWFNRLMLVSGWLASERWIQEKLEMLVVLSGCVGVVLGMMVRQRKVRRKSWRRCILCKGMVGLEFLRGVRLVLGERVQEKRWVRSTREEMVEEFKRERMWFLLI